MKKSIKYKFVIVTPGRSGSEHLSETLNNCNDIIVEGEVFNRTNNAEDSFNTIVSSKIRFRFLSFLFNREKLSRLKWNMPLSYLIRSFFKTKKEDNVVHDFKLSLDQLYAYPMALEYILQTNCKVIYLNREDRLSQVLSLMKAKRTSTYHFRKKTTEEKRHTFDKQQVRKMLAQTNQWEAELLQKLKKYEYIHLSYEQLFENYNQSIDVIREFLALPKTNEYICSDLVKGNPKSLSEWVANLDEIRREIDI